jgi:hypothetical protein
LSSFDPGEGASPAAATALQSGDWVVVQRRRFNFEVRDVLFALQSVALIVSFLR